MSRYAELAVTTNFSFLRGASHPQELVDRAGELGLAAIGIALNQLALFQKGQRRVDHARARAVGAVEQRFDLANQVITVARLIGDQRQQHQFQVARGEYPRPTAAAFTAGTFRETIAAIAVFAEVRAVVVRVIV